MAYDVEGLSVYLDYIHMMCYDYHGAWDKQTGANAPLKGTDTLNVVSTSLIKDQFLFFVAYKNKIDSRIIQSISKRFF